MAPGAVKIEAGSARFVEAAGKARAAAKADPVNPQRVAWELSPLLPPDAIVTSDSGSCANWFARDLKVQRGQMYSLSGGLASMGAAVPYAIAAKFAHPGRPVIALVGDGAMQMNNMAELITVAKYWRLWKDPRWIVCVFNNEDLNQVTWEQRVMEGDPKFEATQKIPDVPYHRFAELIGLKGIYCNDEAKVQEAWRQALACGPPVVLEFKTDPEVPPLPSHITLEQAKSFMSTIVERRSERRLDAGRRRQAGAQQRSCPRIRTKFFSASSGAAPPWPAAATAPAPRRGWRSRSRPGRTAATGSRCRPAQSGAAGHGRGASA
jgi:pyruvate dehydrogenase (quinone)